MSGKNSFHEQLSNRAIHRDIAKRQEELRQTKRQRKVYKAKRVKLSDQRKQLLVQVEGENGAKETEFTDGASSEVLTKRKLKRDIERDNKLWRSFNRHGHDGLQGNDNFTRYYQAQLFQQKQDQDQENDWTEFVKSLSKNLPVTFRLNSSRNTVIALSLVERLKTEFQFKGKFVKVDDDKVISGNVLQQLEMLELDPMLWQVNVSRAGFSKCQVLEPLYHLIGREASIGNLSRQECASMLPALALQVKPSHQVLDMCSSPGSKTEQVLELMRSQQSSHSEQLIKGMLVANDSDPKRIRYLTQRFKNIGDQRMIITCCQGEQFYAKVRAEVFDRIICDVPCTGDGTIRKMPYLWRRWSPERALQLHPLQLAILKNAASVLKVHGRLVYSTCSFNPIENEAVVTALLRASKGAIKLVPSKIPSNFKLRRGLTTWNTDVLNLLEKAQKHPKRERKSRGSFEILPSMVAPTSEEANRFNLHLCERVFPHDNNTGGFFVAVFEKSRPWNLLDEDRKGTLDSNIVLQTAQTALRESGYGVHELFASQQPVQTLSQKNMAHIEANLQLQLAGNSLVQQSDRIYAVNKNVTEALRGWCSGINVMQTGVEVAVLDKTSNQYLPSSEGLWSNIGMIQNKFPVDRMQFQTIVELCKELLTDAETNTDIISVDWLSELLEDEEAEDNDIVEQAKNVPQQSLFCFYLDIDSSSFNHKSSSGPSPNSSKDANTSHKRRLSKKERKRLKKGKGNTNKASKTSSSTPGSSLPSKQQNHQCHGRFSIVFHKFALNQARILSPIEAIESYVECLSSELLAMPDVSVE